MRLKYYMRGLGIGILFSLVVMVLTGANETSTMSDAEIIHAAKELGMVEGNSRLNLSGLSPTPVLTVTVQPTKEVTVTPEPTLEPNPEPTVNLEPTKTPEITKKPTATPIPTIAPVIEPTKPPEPTISPDTGNNEETITLNIVKGMYSHAVAEEAYRIGLVEDITEFDKYLMNNGYASNICINSYEFKKGASMWDIAEKITKK
jgi:hypothetical protein